MLPCISELNIDDLDGLAQGNNSICTIELTVATGLEEVAGQECREKLNAKPFMFRGRVILDMPLKDVKQVMKLRSIENINVVLLVEPKFNFPNEREECFKKMYKFVNFPDWRKGIQVWQSVFGVGDTDPFEAEQELGNSCCAPRPELDLKLMKNDSSISGNLPEEVLSSIISKREERNKAKEKQNNQNGEEKNPDSTQAEQGGKDKGDKDKDKNFDDKQRKGNGPKFRVSCHRVGSSHKFGSSEAARQFGGGINEKFGWPVDLSRFDLEVMFNVINEFVYVGVSLTKEPLFKRNLTFFGPTNLRSTICYNMLQLAKPLPGDVVLDPMCGGGSIPIEGALSFPACFHLGGDNNEAASTRSRMNITHLPTPTATATKTDTKPPWTPRVDTVRWDVTALPLVDSCADVVVCDLPFGKRVGRKADNRVLYWKALVEMARVTRPESGRAVLLTHDRNSITKSLTRVSSLWKNFSTRMINIGGLVGGIYLLQRSGVLSQAASLEENKDKESRGKKRKIADDPKQDEK